MIPAHDVALALLPVLSSIAGETRATNTERDYNGEAQTRPYALVHGSANGAVTGVALDKLNYSYINSNRPGVKTSVTRCLQCCGANESLSLTSC
jgi:hypothetical protein